MDWGQLIVNIFVMGPALIFFFILCPLFFAMIVESFK